MIAACPAKVNLRLRVFARDETGFHSVETLLARTDLTDSLEMEESPRGIEISVSGPASEGVPETADNLCVRAAAAFMDLAFAGKRNRPGIRLALTKNVPAGAGLGGGSADAGAALRLLAARWPRLDSAELFRLAGTIGSDVPFGLLDVPLALGWERGRRLLPLRPPPPREALLVCPPFAVATPSAYGWLAEDRRSGTAFVAGAAGVLPGPTRLAEWPTLERLMTNDLQSPVFARHPELANALRIMQDAGGASSMTGSGSAIFAIFPEAESRSSAERALNGAGYGEGVGWRTHEIRLPV